MRTTALKQVKYDPSVFLNVETVDEAVRVILTSEDGLSSVQRWRAEAPYLMDIIKQHVRPQSHVLDYGCGIGRMAKPLIDMLQCSVVGVDISPNMRALSASCVDSDAFFAIAPAMLKNVKPSFDAALAIWTLQHVLDLKLEVGRIFNAMRCGGALFVVNNKQRVLPSNDGRWIDDQLDVRAELVAAGFREKDCGALSGADIAPGVLSTNTFWAVYRKP